MDAHELEVHLHLAITSTLILTQYPIWVGLEPPSMNRFRRVRKAQCFTP